MANNIMYAVKTPYRNTTEMQDRSFDFDFELPSVVIEKWKKDFSVMSRYAYTSMFFS